MYLDTRHGQGPYPLLLVLREKKTVASWNLGIKLLPEEWDEERQCTGNSKLDILLRQKRLDIEMQMLSIDCEGLTAPQIKEKIEERLHPRKVLFLDYFRQITDTYTNTRTRDIYKMTIKAILRFSKASEHLTLDDVTPGWVGAFERDLLQYSPSANARNIHLRNIRHIMNAAITEGLTNNYPFRRMHIKAQETLKRSLPLDYLVRYLREPVGSANGRYRDIFKLMLYLLGINITDLCMLRPENIRQGRIEYIRRKTGKMYSILVHPAAMAIIERHRGKGYLLDIMDRYKDAHDYLKHINAALKSIIPEAPYNEISTYWARHTVATLMANELDLPIDIISEALGHQHGSKITAVYVNWNQQKVDDANRALIELIEKKCARLP